MRGTIMNYLGPNITDDAALLLQRHILEGAKGMGIVAITIVILNSEGALVSSHEADCVTESGLILAEGKAISALEFQCDTVMTRHTWIEHASDRSKSKWIEKGGIGWGERAIAGAKELVPSFTDLAGGVLIKSEHGAAVVGAVGVVTNQTQIIDHKLAELRPEAFAVAA